VKYPLALLGLTRSQSRLGALLPQSLCLTEAEGHRPWNRWRGRITLINSVESAKRATLPFNPTGSAFIRWGAPVPVMSLPVTLVEIPPGKPLGFSPAIAWVVVGIDGVCGGGQRTKDSGGC